MTLLLYTAPLSMFGAKAEIALLEKGVEFELVMVPFVKGDRYEPKHPEVVRINPKGQVPVLIHGPVETFDSTVIFEYLEDAFPVPPLWPTGAAARAEARLLELKADDIVFMNIARIFGLEDTPDDPVAVAARGKAYEHYAEMEARLAKRDYLAGPFSYADIGFFMAQFYGERKGAVMNDATPRLLDWRARVLARPAVREVIGRMGAWLKSEGRDAPGTSPVHSPRGAAGGRSPHPAPFGGRASGGSYGVVTGGPGVSIVTLTSVPPPPPPRNTLVPKKRNAATMTTSPPTISAKPLLFIVALSAGFAQPKTACCAEGSTAKDVAAVRCPLPLCGRR